jgi:hypothetical protein
MRKLACSTIVLLLLCISICPADSFIETLLPPELFEELSTEGSLRNSLHGSSAPVLIPAVPDQGEIVRRVQDLELTVGTEILALYKKETVDFNTPDARVEIYNILRSISTMEGIEYYSASRGRMRTLFDRSFVIAGPKDTEALPDPLVEEIPPYSDLYVYQKDLTFGENVYLWEYRYPGSYYLIVNRNITTMRYFLLPMVKPRQSVTFILLIPDGQQILFYGASGAQTMRLLGLERSREDSFYNRLNAIYGWFSDRIAAVF